MLKFLHRRSLRKKLEDIENCLRAHPHWDYAGPMNDVLSATMRALPEGLAQTPGPATRALCMDLRRTGKQALRAGYNNAYVACTAMTLYFSAWELACCFPSDTLAPHLKDRAHKIIDRFTLAAGHENATIQYRSFDTWYAAYKRGAAQIDASFLNADGSSIIDFMENALLLRAYNNGIDPIALGRKFASGFDIESFGGR